MACDTGFTSRPSASHAGNVQHRLATVLRAERIVVMKAGRVVDAGTHEELAARGGLYARLTAMRFGMERSAEPA